MAKTICEPGSSLLPLGLGLVLLIAGLSVIPVADAVGQTGTVEFETREHDFGIIPEGIDAAHRFSFRNVGDVPVRLVDVRASCGCTTPSWSREAIAPGDTGSVTAVYHSDGRPGPFSRGITIETDGEPRILQIRLRGEVEAAQMDGVRLGQMIAQSDTIRFSRIRAGVPAVASLGVQNVGSVPLHIVSVGTSTPALFTDFEDRILAAGRSDEITFILDTDELRSGETVSVEAVLHTNDVELPEKRVVLVGTVDS